MANPQNPGSAPAPQDPWTAGSMPQSAPGAQYLGTAAYPAAQYPGVQYPGAAPGYPPAPGYAGQQGPYGMPAYPGGGMPGYPSQASLPPAPQRPPTVTAAFWLWMLAAAGALLSGILLFSSDVWNQALAAADVDSRLTAASVHALVNTARTIAIAFMVIFVALYVFFAVKMLLGRNWARVVLTVLGGLTIVSQLSGASSVTVGEHVYHPTSGVAIGWVQAACAVLAIIAMFLSASNQYFTASKAHRAYQR